MQAGTTWLNAHGPMTLHKGVRLLFAWQSLCPKALALLDAVERLHQRYRAYGLHVVSVHVPEYAVQDAEHVADVVQERGVTHTVIVNDATLMGRFGLQATGAMALMSEDGTVHTVADDALSAEATLRQLLRLHGARHMGAPLQWAVQPAPVQIQHFGYEKGRFDNDGIELGHVKTYRAPRLRRHVPVLSGRWSVNASQAVSHGGSIHIPYHAGTLSLVASAPSERDVTVEHAGLSRTTVGDAVWFTKDDEPRITVDSPRVSQLWVSDRVEDGTLTLHVPAQVALHSVLFGEPVR